MPANSTNAAGYMLNIGAVGISGALFGMPVEALILGGIAGALAHGLGRSDNNPALTVLASVMLAGSLTPAATHFLVQHIGLPDILLRPAVPLAIGLGWPWLWPVVSKPLRGIIEGFLSKFGGAK